jgi:multidrug resistance efflux pump
MRILAVVAGLLLLGAGGFILLGEYIAGVSTVALVNARLIVLRAPIDGELRLRVSSIGTRVGANEAIGDIADLRAETARLAELQRMAATLEADLQRAERLRASLVAARDAFSAHAAEYKKGRVSQLQTRIGEAKALKEAAQARLGEQQTSLARANELAERGVQTAATLERVRSAHQVAAEDLKIADQRIAYLTVELEAAQKDTFLGDSYNDAPYSMQRIKELELRLSETDAQIEHIGRALQHAREQRSAELLRHNRLTSAVLDAPNPGLIWDFLANNGEIVRRGQDLVRLVDCRSAVITASVSERVYNGLRQGSAAQFRLRGSSRVFDATITRLAGSGAETLYRNLAVTPTPQHLRGYDVTLTSPQLSADPELSCAVGRTGRVVFSEGLFESIRKVMTQLGLQ